jgi:hypothetical protein
MPVPSEETVFHLLPVMPRIPDGMTPRDRLIMHLHVAAEIEHDLMVQYLYAAYSLGGPQAEEHPNEVRSWRDTLLTVAREEMGHLLTVQNLLLLVGGPATFERHHHVWSTTFAPFTFKLERFSLGSLALYTWAEMPNELGKSLYERILEVLPKERVRTPERQVPTTPPVGLIYRGLIDLVGDRKNIPDSMFDPATYPYQATWDEFARGYRPRNAKPYAIKPDIVPDDERKARVIVTPMATRTEALAALQDLAAQGEGASAGVDRPDENEPSHFDRFAKVFKEFDSILTKHPKGWSPSRPVAENPYAGEALYAPAHMTLIKSDVSHKWAALFNFRYRILLSLLAYLFRVPRDGGPSGGMHRAQILSRLFGEMYAMKAVAGIVVRLPLDDACPQGTLAGPPFQLPYTLGQPLSKANFWRMHLDLLDSAARLAGALLEADAIKRAPADGQRYLQLMVETDRESRRWIETILEGREEWPA